MAVTESTHAAGATPWGSLARRLRVLHIRAATDAGDWLAEALRADRAVQIELTEAPGANAGLAMLRDDAFDAVLIAHDPDSLDALELVAALRAGGQEDPLVVLGQAAQHDLDALCYEVGADAYVCLATATTRSLLWELSRAWERRNLIRENRGLVQADRRRLRQEHNEAERLLEQQRSLVRDLEDLHPSAGEASEPFDTPAGLDLNDHSAANQMIARHAAAEEPVTLPEPLVNHYRELLRAYVIMGSGNLSQEMTSLAEVLARLGVSARQTMQLHLHALEDQVRGLGSRSARHVMARADLLVLEIMVHLSEGYRRRLLQQESDSDPRPATPYAATRAA